MKKLLIIPLTLGLLLSASGCGSQSEDPSKTAQADIGTVESVVEDNGIVINRDPYPIFPTVSGKILSCSFEEGDTVKKDDVLYVLDSTALEDQITQAELGLKNAKQVYAQAVDACDDLTVRAKAAGTITAVRVHTGDFVSAGMPIAEVVDQKNLLLTVPFSPTDAASLKVGAAASLSFPAFTGDVSGKVDRIYPSATALPGGRTGVFAEIRFQNPGALLGGETAFASVGNIACMEAGTVQSVTAQALFSTQAGQVLSLPIDEGDVISVGQTLMTIDNAALTNGRDNARLAVESAEVSLAQLTAKRDDFILRAPADGTMISRTMKDGDFAAAANPLAVLATESSLGINVDVDEIYIDKIQPGQEARVEFTDDTGMTRCYDAAVRRVDEAGMVNGGVTSYSVELTIEDTSALKAGMNVSVSILTGQRDSCLRIPTAAISQSSVQLQKGKETVETPVTVGISGGGYTEILSGLAEGDTVVYD